MSTVVEYESPKAVEGRRLGPFGDDPLSFASESVDFDGVYIGIVFTFTVQRLQVRARVVSYKDSSKREIL